ncbi:hypothetical protein [Desulfitibacter alkalitolerans]|uniref:hypothetical protein n=1 Tax=Desulfitibacter alkalitolerans TaxID=264641 RepID=UPI000484E207|nr:hypothetical protein [Desulfitibacter alkalitolerans]
MSHRPPKCKDNSWLIIIIILFLFMGQGPIGIIEDELLIIILLLLFMMPNLFGGFEASSEE